MRDFTVRIANLEDESLAPDRIGTLHLMEASAGTGKTFSIQTIYLRLILIEGLTVQQILTVTFTNDATKELRDRLQGILREALDYLEGSRPISDPNDRTRIIVEAAKGHRNEEKLLERLRLALIDFDMAAIFTIHGFCQRVLKRFAFETGQGFDLEPASNADAEIEQLCRDWWRRNVYTMNRQIANALSESGKFSLSAIIELAKTLITKPDAILDNNGSSIEAITDHVEQLIRTFNAEPVAPQETCEYPSANREAAEAIDYLQARIREFRDCAETNTTLASSILLDICRYSKPLSVELYPRAEALKQACEQFMHHVPKGTRANGFAFDAGGQLMRVSCPLIDPTLTDAIRDTAKQLATPATAMQQYAPVSIRQNSSLDSYKLLAAHFSRQQTETAASVFNAIKQIAQMRCGVKPQVQISIDAINPAFKSLHGSLVTEQSRAVYQAALDVKQQYQDSRSAARTASFNDYLVNLREALNASTGLAGVLREEFKAALIDEFQDTDPIQWGIFERIFKDAATPCFLVGDPKQAIYRFRNGDVETYLKATEDVSSNARYPLTTNYRSEERLIAAVNQIFLDPTGTPTFGEPIEFVPSQAPPATRARPVLTINGAIDPKPFKILLIDNPSSGIPGKTSPTAEFAYRLTAQEIARILADAHQTIDGRRIEPQDIAILVKKHDEGNAIAAELKALNIPSVRQGTGDVWQTDEGRDLWVMLEAVMDAQNPNPVRRALITPWGGLSAEQLQALNDRASVIPPYGRTDVPMAMEDFVAIFMDFNATWRKRGFPAMFRKMMAVFSIKPRLLANPDKQGQRRLTNIIHLSELIAHKLMEARKTPEGVLAWIRRQFDSSTADGGDETNLRLETDNNAVRIMTIFTSKGLQFPIVFAPTLFMVSASLRGNSFAYHEADGNLRIVQKTGDNRRDKQHQDKEKHEIEQELVRQIYVAVTRAIHRTVIIALKGKPVGTLGHLLRLPYQDGPVDNNALADRFDHLVDGRAAIAISEAEEASIPESPPVAAPFAIIKTPLPRPAIDTSRGHSSFSSISPHALKPTPRLDRGDASTIKDDDRVTLAGEEEATRPPQGIFAFPSGARTGTCWHALFEDLDFAHADDDTIQGLVTQKLGTYGFLKNSDTNEERIAVTTEMVKQVLRTPLPRPEHPALSQPFAFSAITDANRQTEWAFNFSAARHKRTREIKDAIGAHAAYASFADALGDWDQDIPSGYMTGFVDLLFRHEGIYFIADWKSNRRNGSQNDFGPDGIREEMSTHRYWLQYLIYTVAVHQYLSTALPGYDYDKHVGGVYYVFLRGVDGNQHHGHTNGIYHDRPPLGLIQSLSSILGDFQ